jgi:Secretion system C-terminal sorting domain
MKSFTMYILKKRFKPLVWLFLFLGFYGLNAQTYDPDLSSNYYKAYCYFQGGPLTGFPEIGTDDISTTGTLLSFANDDGAATINLGAFNFNFYCKKASSLKVGVDGVMLVDDATTTIPNTNTLKLESLVSMVISPHFDELKLGTGNVKYQFLSSPRRLVVQWTNVSPAASINNNMKLTFRAILYENTNNILFYYPDVSLASEADGSVSEQDIANTHQFGKDASFGLRTTCLSGRFMDGVNNVGNAQDGISLKPRNSPAIVATWFEPILGACPVLPIPDQDFIKCKGDLAFDLPVKSEAANGSWEGSGAPYVTPLNNRVAKFDPRAAGNFIVTWNPGCPLFSYKYNVRVDDKVDILTPIESRSGCSQTTFTLQGTTPSVLTVANNPVWQFTSGSLNPVPTFPTTANPITLTDVFGQVQLKYVNGVCSTDVVINNYPPPPVTDTIIINVCSNSTILSFDPTLAGATNVRWRFGPNKPSTVNFSPAPPPNSSTATITGLSTTTNPVVVNVTYQIGTNCFSKSFKVGGASPPPASVDGNSNSEQTITQCGDGKFTLLADNPSDPTFSGSWGYVVTAAGVTPSVLSGNSVTISNVPVGVDVKVRWIVSLTSGSSTSCNDTVTVTLRNLPPVVAMAGSNKFNCNDSSFIMTANNPAPNIGTWSVVSPSSFSSSNILNINAFNTKVNNVPINMPVTLRWTVTNTCSSSSSDVVLTNSESKASAGQNQSKCSFSNTSFMLVANTPSAGSGEWSIVSSTPAGFSIANVSPTNMPSTTVSNVPVGTSVTLRWTVTNNGCVSSSTVTVTNNQAVTASIMPVLPQCNISMFNLMANPIVLPVTGVWSVVGTVPAGLSISSPNTSMTTVSGVPSNKPVTVRWTVTNGNGTCSSSATVILNNVAPATVLLKNFKCPTTTVINLDNLLDSLIGDGVWTALGTTPGTFSGGNHPVVNGTTLNGTTNFTGYEPSAMERKCGEINLQISVTNACTMTPIVKTIKILMGTSVVVPANLNLGLDYNDKNCEMILTGEILCKNDYKHYSVKICRVGIVPANGKCNCNLFSYIPNNKIDANFIGQTIGVEISDACGNHETTCVKIEDKKQPVIECPKDVSVFCNVRLSLDTDSPSQSVTGDLGLDDVTPPLPAMDGSVQDCSPTRQSYEDECKFMESCTTPFTELTKPTVAKILACLKIGEGVNKDSLANALRDRMITTGGDVIKFIIRRWSAEDLVAFQDPNVSKPCYQIIAIRRLPFNIVAPADRKYSCHGTITECTPNIPEAPASLASSLTGYPFVDMNANGTYEADIDILLNTEGAKACKFFISEKDDTFRACKGSRKISRTFIVTDECSNRRLPIIQNIEVMDLTPPDVRTTYISYERVAKKYCYNDGYGLKEKTIFDVVAKSEVLPNFTGKSLRCAPDIQGDKKIVFALGDPNNCNRYYVKFRMVACDHFCTKGSVTVSTTTSTLTSVHLTNQDYTDSKGVLNSVWEFSGYVTADPMLYDPDYTFGEGDCVRYGANCKDIKFIATDSCGNVSALQTFRVMMIDIQAPTATCITNHTTSLTTNGTSRIAAPFFNNGSTDNCGIAGFAVRRMDKKYFNPNTIDGFDCTQPFEQDTCFRDYVEFTCDDVGKPIMVEMLVYDINCNANSCMVTVNVDNKNQPRCVPPASETTSCVNIAQKRANPKAYFEGTPQSFYNCGYKLEEVAVTGILSNCGVGTLQRNWEVRNCANNVVLSRCSQDIIVTGKSDFSVDFPDDLVVTCAGEVPSIQCLKNQMLDPNSWGKGLDGAIKNDGCGAIDILIKDDTLMANPNTLACGGILRKIWVSSRCRVNDDNALDRSPGLQLTGDNKGYGTALRSLPCAVTGAASTLSSTSRRFRDGDDLTGTNADGLIYFVQKIQFNDVTPPTAVVLADTAIGFVKAQCKANHKRILSATDACGANRIATNAIRYQWFVLVNEIGKDPNALTQIANGNTNEVIVDDLSAGTYFVKWSAMDLCNNSTPQYSYTLTVRDDEAPSIVANLKVAVLGGRPLGGSGMATICVEDLLTSLKDNCTNVAILRRNARLVRQTPSFIYPEAQGDTCAMINCTDLADSARLVLWTRDAAGIPNYVRIAIKVQDNANVCPLGRVAALSGTIVNDKNIVVQNARISVALKGNATPFGSSMTKENGTFELNNLFVSQNYDFRVTKEDEVYSGVTTLDISLMSRHLLEIDKLKTPGSIIAADVDGNRVVNGADMIHLRNFILRKTSSLPASPWKFVPKQYNFINPNEPLSEDFPQLVSIENIPQSVSLDFVAIKIGDVNNTYRPQNYVPIAPRNSHNLTFATEDLMLEAGKTYSIKLKANDFKATEYQFTLGFKDGVATVKSVESGNLPNMGNGNFAVFKNAITTSWNGVAKESEVEALTMTFVANQSVKLSDVLTINSSITPSDATNTEGAVLKPQLTFGNGVVKEIGEFALYQNRPNPMSNTTAIGFNLPKESDAILTIYNIEGKAMKVVNSTFKAGYNEVMIEKESFQTSGIYYYRLETSEHSATKKMVVSF